MAVHITFQCDSCVADHAAAKSSAGVRVPWPEDSALRPGFDAESETWGDMLTAVRGAGWRLEMAGATVGALTCPRHLAATQQG